MVGLRGLRNGLDSGFSVFSTFGGAAFAAARFAPPAPSVISTREVAARKPLWRL